MWFGAMLCKFVESVKDDGELVQVRRVCSKQREHIRGNYSTVHEEVANNR